jgi:hypothetical protein
MDASPKRDVLRFLSRSTLTLVLIYGLLRTYAFLAAYGNLQQYPLSGWISSDVLLFQGWAPGLSHFHFPINDQRWQYPPGAGIFLTLPQWISQAIHVHYEQAFQGLVLLSDVALLVVLIWAGRRLKAPLGGLGPAWLWAFAPLFVGPILAARFDTLVSLTAVCALVLIYVKRPAWAGIVMGVGLLIKAWPVLMIAAARRRDLPRALLGTAIGATVVVGVGLFWSNSWSFFDNEIHRGLQIESVGALPWVISWRFGHPQRYGYSFGALEIISSHAHAVGLGLSLVGFALLFILGVLRLAGRLEHVAGVDVAYAALLVSVATSRVYSPQYNVWLIAVGAAVLLDRRTQLRAAVWWVVGASFFGQLVYPIYYTQLMQGYTSGVFVQTARIVCLLAATTIAYYRVVRGGLTKPTAAADQDLSLPASV